MTSQSAEAIVFLLKDHINPSSGNRTVLAGAQAAAIAEQLAKHFYQHQFESVADPCDLIPDIDNSNESRSVELVCLLDAFQGLTNRDRESVLARLRDTSAARILHLEYETTGEDGWSLMNSLSLGFRRIDAGTCNQRSWQLFEFDIANYKSTPRWLNADHWCNPQQWDRSRW